ncbi:MAG: hypothetical protein GIW95_08275 [Candidatus Eremiobacteraeota bacterium]|nr:hypothetical protein [Candidatus Eremiobacteraeota bacterium]
MIWTIHGSLEIPFAHIRDARVQDENGWSHLWGKIAGTNAPGFKMAGTFWFDGGLAFLNYSDGRNCVVITTNHETYKTLIVQLEDDQDPAAIVAEIKRRLSTTPAA